MTSNVDAAKAILDAQAAKGLGKYGVPLERSDATLSRLARHGAEEMADSLAYFVELERRAAAVEADNARFRAALDRIAAWGDGPVVTSSFDEPHAARIARAALTGNREMVG